MRLNDPRVVAEVTAVFHRYEAALVAGDQPAMAELFWSSTLVTRFGAGDYQVGADELARFRAQRGPISPGRQLEGTRIVTFGDDAGVVTTLVYGPDRSSVGRQSQTWIRLDGTWQIVHAHVSQIPDHTRTKQ